MSTDDNANVDENANFLAIFFPNFRLVNWCFHTQSFKWFAFNKSADFHFCKKIVWKHQFTSWKSGKWLEKVSFSSTLAFLSTSAFLTKTPDCMMYIPQFKLPTTSSTPQEMKLEILSLDKNSCCGYDNISIDLLFLNGH